MAAVHHSLPSLHVQSSHHSHEAHSVSRAEAVDIFLGKSRTSLATLQAQAVEAGVAPAVAYRKPRPEPQMSRKEIAEAAGTAAAQMLAGTRPSVKDAVFDIVCFVRSFSFLMGTATAGSRQGCEGAQRQASEVAAR